MGFSFAVFLHSCTENDQKTPIILVVHEPIFSQQYDDIHSYSGLTFPSGFDVEVNPNIMYNALAYTTDGTQKAFIATIENRHSTFYFCDSMTGITYSYWANAEELEQRQIHEGYGTYRTDSLVRQSFQDGYMNYGESSVILLDQIYGTKSRNISFLLFCNPESDIKVIQIPWKQSMGRLIKGYRNTCIVDSCCYDINTGDSLYTTLSLPPIKDFVQKLFGTWLSKNEILYIKERMLYKEDLRNAGKSWVTPVPYLENEEERSRINYELLEQSDLFIQYKVLIVRYDGTTFEFSFKVDPESGDIIQ